MNIYRHKKTGGLYAFVCTAYLEANMAPVVVYEQVNAFDPMRFVRPHAEFFDGRFEPLETTEKVRRP